jgi:hypothetical protein
MKRLAWEKSPDKETPAHWMAFPGALFDSSAKPKLEDINRRKITAVTKNLQKVDID